MTDKNRRSRGVSTYNEILRPKEKERSETAAVVGIRELTLDHLYADIWQRGQLSLQERRLVTMAILAVQGHTSQLKTHIIGALRSDVPVETLNELMVQVGHYGGWAAGVSGHEVVQNAHEEEGA